LSIVILSFTKVSEIGYGFVFYKMRTRLNFAIWAGFFRITVKVASVVNKSQ